jgi:NADH-quinone oxidoreductase subunit J
MTHPLILAGSAANNTEVITFWVLAVIAVGAALGMILTRRAVHCAVLLAVVMLILAGMYAMQGAPFLAFVQVIVYTGAVLMLFLFVMMIVGITASDSLIETIRGQRLFAGLAGIALLVLLSLVLGHAAIGAAAPSGVRNSSGNVPGLARLVFTTYVFPFEVTSALLITAALGAMVLAHRERTSPRPTQRMLSRRRIASGRPTPLPGPGTYARHNAVDMPALLPDGSQSELSVSGVLTTQGAPGRAASRRAIAAENPAGNPQPGAGGQGSALIEPSATHVAGVPGGRPPGPALPSDDGLSREDEVKP